MNIKTQVTVIIVVLLAMVYMINMIRKNRLEIKYALLWFVLGIGVIIFTCFPMLTTFAAKFLGIGQPVNLLFFAGFCFALLIIYSLSLAISRLSVRVKKLTQELALLQKKLEDIEEGERE